MGEVTRHRRNLPHWDAPGETYFLTFALRRPPVVDLTEPQIGQMVVDALRFFDGERYLLFDYTVMPDHVHLILRPIVQEAQGQCVSRVTHSIKSWLAHRINDVMGRSGPVWHEESWDSVIRNAQDYTTKAAYIYDNPRRKGLVDDPSKWPWWGIGSGGG